ncbi:unnamed protein product [Blepharisma stoltei]|uniref:RCC1-like domain-containing protein n=1 Tax=Blepharisma stoltei TaxID=1481888 RepID=A0AAU9IMA7_9CILI|nr:unnamed protein product [Blepharisma stoltei]
MGNKVWEPQVQTNQKKKHPKLIFCQGFNKHNECGGEDGYVTRERVATSVSAGFNHNLAILASGQLVSWGSNEFGQLGSQGNTWLESWIYEPPKVQTIYFPRQFGKISISQISAGAWHSACISNTGILFTWGLGTSGQLGYPANPDDFVRAPGTSHKFCPNPKSVDYFTNHPIYYVSCGSTFTVVLSRGREVFIFGDGSHGVFGNGKKGKKWEPQLIEALIGKEIRKIACGWNHVLALSMTGKVYYWGNQYADMRENFPDTEIPELVPGLEDNFITDIACGDYHSAALSRRNPNALFTWGGNGYGQLGYVIEDEDPYINFIPKRVEIYHEISSISCGGLFMVAKLRDGTVLGWGSNKHRQFGKNGQEFYQPLVLFDGSVNKISRVMAGHSHIAVLCKKEIIFGEFLAPGKEAFSPAETEASIPTGREEHKESQFLMYKEYEAIRYHKET